MALPGKCLRTVLWAVQPCPVRRPLRPASRCQGALDDLWAYAGLPAKRIVENDHEANRQTDRRHVNHVDLPPERFLAFTPAEKGGGDDKKKENDPEVVRDVKGSRRKSSRPERFDP